MSLWGFLEMSAVLDSGCGWGRVHLAFVGVDTSGGMHNVANFLCKAWCVSVRVIGLVAGGVLIGLIAPGKQRDIALW